MLTLISFRNQLAQEPIATPKVYIHPGLILDEKLAKYSLNAFSYAES